MKQIYRSALSVIAWLGADKEAEDCLRRLHLLAKQPKSSEVTAEIVKELGYITQLPWFHRRWVIQEVVLSPHVVITCGRVSVPWTRFFQHLLQESREGVIDSIVLLLDMWRSSILKDDTGTGFRMFELLTEIHEAGCADDRDRVYALGALASDMEVQDGSGRTTISPDKAIIPADYTISAESLYHKVTIELITRKAALKPIDLFVQRAIRHIENELDGMPSWVPDWRKPLVREPLWFHEDVRAHVNHND